MRKETSSDENENSTDKDLEELTNEVLESPDVMQQAKGAGPNGQNTRQPQTDTTHDSGMDSAKANEQEMVEYGGTPRTKENDIITTQAQVKSEKKGPNKFKKAVESLQESVKWGPFGGMSSIPVRRVCLPFLRPMSGRPEPPDNGAQSQAVKACMKESLKDSTPGRRAGFYFVWNVKEAVDEREVSSAHGATNNRAKMVKFIERYFPEVAKPDKLIMHSSPLSVLTFEKDEKGDANIISIEPDARFFCYIYHKSSLDIKKQEIVLQELKKVHHVDLDDPLLRCLIMGGFVYLNERFDVVAVHALYVKKRRSSNNIFRFGKDVDLNHVFPPNKEMVKTLIENDRWWPVSDKMIANKGFTHFAWIGPEEKFGDAKFNEFLHFGGFGYAKQTEESRKNNLKLEEKEMIFLPIVGAKMYVADTILFQVTAKV
jgi:hypothetical protein